jgi:hypothetical protein
MRELYSIAQRMSIFPSRPTTSSGEEVAAQFQTGGRIRPFSDHANVPLIVANEFEPGVGRGVLPVRSSPHECIIGRYGGF